MNVWMFGESRLLRDLREMIVLVTFLFAARFWFDSRPRHGCTGKRIVGTASLWEECIVGYRRPVVTEGSMCVALFGESRGGYGTMVPCKFCVCGEVWLSRKIQRAGIRNGCRDQHAVVGEGRDGPSVIREGGYDRRGGHGEYGREREVRVSFSCAERYDSRQRCSAAASRLRGRAPCVAAEGCCLLLVRGRKRRVSCDNDIRYNAWRGPWRVRHQNSS